jgi:hypothetical protein
MVWQDLILTSGQFLLFASLIPSVLSKDKPALPTSVLAAVVLGAFGVVYITLHLWFTAVMVAVTCLTWALLAYQKYVQR